MRFSVSLPRPGIRPDTDMQSQAHFAAVVEECGFHAVSATDHPFPVVGGESVSHHAYDPFILLTHLASRTERLRLHFSVLVASYRNPFLAAQMIAALDEISAGRVIVAIGAGYNRKEFDALGGRFSDRGRHTDEVAAAMRTAWRGEPVHLDHPDWHTAGNTLFPSFADRPNPQLWRGGNSARALASAATVFDGWAPLEVNEKWAAKAGTTGVTMSSLPQAIEGYRQRWIDAGRPGRPDVCLVRVRTDWHRDPERLVTETRQLQKMGVTWLELTPHGESLIETSASLRSIASILRDASLLAED